MQKVSRKHFARLGVLVLLLAALAGGATVLGSAGAAPNPSVANAVAASTLSATTCTLAGTTRSCDVYAKTGSVALPNGVTLPVWGYAATANGAPQIPGPLLIANQGETLQVILHNRLAEATSLDFPGQSVVPDTAGVAPGAVKTYVIPASQPGTTLYEAGPSIGFGTSGVIGGSRQVAMGLSGVLIVRPTGCASCAYNANSSYDDEALVFVSEIDPGLNAAPRTYDLHGYNPKYWLINGKAYPQTDPIPTAAGHKVLLRYVNGGLQDHSLGVLGMHQTVVANDGKPLNQPYQVVAETLSAGQTIDMLATVPPTAPGGSKFALYNTAIHLDNNGATNTDGTIAFGGMLTFLTTAGSGGGAVPPVTSNVNVSPNPTNGTTSVSLSASVTSGTSTITAAEYFVDSVGADGTGLAMTGTFGSATVAVSVTKTPAQLVALGSGNHALYVHGRDANNLWGAASSAVLNLDMTGPASTTLSVSKSPTNGSVDVTVTGTGDDRATGGSNVDAAEFFIDTPGANGAGVALTLNQAPAPVLGLSGTITATSIVSLADGVHSIQVHSHDTLGNWGAFATVPLTVDKTGPTTSNVVIRQTPNNGTVPFDPNTFVVQTNVSVTDPISGGVQTNVVAAEGFLDTLGANGSGTQLLPGTGSNFNSPSITAYMQISLYSIQALTEGPHTIYVHGLDAAGNWGAFASGTLIVDKRGPTISNVVTTLNPTNGASNVTLTASAVDPIVTGTTSGSIVSGAEWFDGVDPGQGAGTAMSAASGTFNQTSTALTATLAVGTWTSGTHTISVRALDIAGNWGPVTTNSLVVGNGPAISSVAATSITAASATIGWTTSVPASSQVDYGTTAAYGTSTALNSTLVTSHTVNLAGLTANTLYHFRVRSTASSNTSVSSDFTFTTLGAATQLVGYSVLQPGHDSNAAGVAEAFAYSATASGTATKLYVYIDASNTATSVVVGIYGNATGNNPGTRLASAVITSPVPGAWNSVTIPATSIVSGTQYWIALLGTGGVVQFRDARSGLGSQTSSQSNLTDLPTTWTTGARFSSSRMNAYLATQ